MAHIHPRGHAILALLSVLLPPRAPWQSSGRPWPGRVLLSLLILGGTFRQEFFFEISVLD